MNVWLATIAYYDTVNATTGTLYYSTGVGYTSSSTATPPNITFDARIKQAAKLRRDMFAAGTTKGRSNYAVGELVLRNNDGGLDGLLNYAFDGRAVTIYYGSDTATFSSGFTTMLVATAEQAEFTATEVRIKLRDKNAELDTPLQTTKYAGDNVLPNGLEGGAELKGKPKPYCLGDVFNVPAVCVNTSKLIYQISDNALSSVDAVRDSGVTLGGSAIAWTDTNVGIMGDVCWSSDLEMYVSTGLQIPGGSYNAGMWTSPDGVTWTGRYLPLADLTAGYGGGRVIWVPETGVFLAGGSKSVIGPGVAGPLYLTSPDGIVWKDHASSWLGGTDAVRGVAYSPSLGLYVGVGANGKIETATDAITWTNRANPFVATTNINAVCWSVALGMFVAVGDNGEMATSTNGTTWTSRTSGFGTTHIHDVTFNETLGMFVAVGASGTMTTSTNGTAWTSRTSSFGSTNINRVAVYSHIGGFFAAGNSGTTATSSDGINWTQEATITTSSPTAAGIAIGNGNILVVTVTDYWVSLSRIPSKTYSSQADLLDDTKAPAAGSVGVYLAGGMVRLGSSPVGQITCDAKQGANAAARTPGQLFASVMTKLGKTYSTSDVTTLDGLCTYVLGYWVGTEEVLARDVLDMIAGSCRAWWGADQLGVFRIQRGPDTTTTSQLTITANDMLEIPRRISLNDPGNGLPVYRYTVRYRKNYAVQDGTSLAGGVTDANRALYGKEWRESATTTSSVQTAYLLAKEALDETLITVAADAATESAARGAIYDSRQDRFEVPIPIDTDALGVDMGEVVTLQHSRYGLSAGAAFAVITIEPDAERNRILLGCWRAA